MEPYLGEIRMFAGNFPPRGWHRCDGAVLPISENEALFALLGTTYGGDGVSTFALPDLRGRVPVGQGRSLTGSTYVLGQRAGTEEITLTINQLPAHSHAPTASSQGTTKDPAGAVWGTPSELKEYVALGTDNNAMLPSSVSGIGGNLPHDNMMPYLPVGFIIALTGIFPSQN